MPVPLGLFSGSAPGRSSRQPSLRGALLAVALGLAVPVALHAEPLPDLSRYPAPALGERRWLVEVPATPPPSRDPALSSSPEDWRVQLIPGRTIEVDCNRFSFGGRLRSQAVPGSDLRIVRISEVTPVASTRMACPQGEPKRKAFVPMGGKPFVVPYNPRQPIVIVAPFDLELRWRLWRAERRQWPALQR